MFLVILALHCMFNVFIYEVKFVWEVLLKIAHCLYGPPEWGLTDQSWSKLQLSAEK